MKDEMRKVITLTYDGNVKMIDDINIDYNNIFAILVPLCGYDIHSYMYIEIFKKNIFAKAFLDYQAVVNFWKDGDVEYTVPLMEEKKEIVSVIDLYNFLYTFNKYECTQSFESVFINSDIPESYTISVNYFHLILETINEDICFELHITDNEPNSSRYIKLQNAIRKLFNNGDSDIFSYSKPKFLRIDKNCWSIENRSSLRPSDLIGFGSIMTDNVLFMTYRDYLDVGYVVKSMSVQIFVFENSALYEIKDRMQRSSNNSDAFIEIVDDIDTPVFPVRSELYWAHNTAPIISIIDALLSYRVAINAICKLFYQYYEKEFLTEPTNIELRECTLLSFEVNDVSNMNRTMLLFEDQSISLDDFISCVKIIKEGFE